MKGIFSKPNQISYIRILLIPLFIVFLLMDLPYKDYIAAFIFIVLSLSDALDGYLARKRHEVTSMGKILDPIADKLLISAALIFLIGRIQLWMAVVIIVREIVITIARILFLPKKVVISASRLGKAKTISQIIAILAVILRMPFNWWLMLIAVIITVVSGLDYLLKMGRLIGEKVLNIPNIITTFRLLLIPLFIINLMKPNMNVALIIFAVIVLFDKLDGISARISQQITRFGRIYDAFTDFTLVVSSYVAFFLVGFLDFFWIIVFSAPSLVIILTRTKYYSKIKEIPQDVLGKISIGISYVAAIAVIIDFVYKFQILVIVAVLAYVYMVNDVYKIYTLAKKNR
ncbi:CDP-diacylglycerol--glycerol-3-phosphate 3-phosphatidyltransferase [Candidatus Woesearchaeota archaeon]|nr:CDP-diacylglycerol--glycerol-3-phosphate 3-phosphatidyltransferase [Candidatus Woesearchaeota archaeon]